jgi:hypothetical protein
MVPYGRMHTLLAVWGHSMWLQHKGRHAVLELDSRIRSIAISPRQDATWHRLCHKFATYPVVSFYLKICTA